MGLKWDYFLSDQIQFGVDTSIGIPLLGNFTIIFPDRMLQAAQDQILSNSLNVGISWKIQAPITYWVSNTFGLTLNPFIESIVYEESYIGRLETLDWDFTEPESRTYQFGAQLKAVFRL